MAVPDVPAYLSYAQWPHGGMLPTESAFFAGYGLTLSAFGWLSGATLHTVALIVNGLFAALIVIVTGQLCQLLRLPIRFLVPMVLLSAVHPAVSSASRIAWPETMLTLIVLAIAWFVLRNDSWSWRLSSFLVWVAVLAHPRSLVIVVAFVAAAFASKKLTLVLLNLSVWLVPAVLTIWLCDCWPTARITAAVDAKGIQDLLDTGTGQVAAMGVASLGLALVGVMVGLTRWATHDGRQRGSWEIFISVGAVSMLGLGTWVLAGSDRVDTLLYSRYLDPWTLPLIIVALAAIHRRQVTKRSIYLSAAILSLSTLCIVLNFSTYETSHPRRIMTLSSGLLWTVLSNNTLFVFIVAGLLGIAGLKFCQCSLVRVLWVTLAIAMATTVVNHHRLHQIGEISKGQSTTAAYVPELETCLAHDASTKHYALWLFRLELPSMHHERVDISAGQMPCGPYVIVSEGQALKCSGMELVAMEQRATWGLWHHQRLRCS